MLKTPKIAVLGSGIMGSSTALLLARRGAEVSLFDASDKPFSAASRWNEGKIHLGFLYNADQSLMTARRILPGGLLFKPLLEDLIGCSIDSVTTSADDNYLCHRNSVVQPEAMFDYLQRVAHAVRQNPEARRYLVDVSECQVKRLTRSELAAISGSPDIIAGFRVPERSVSTNWIADRFIDALSAEELIQLNLNTRVKAVRREAENDPECRWHVESEVGVHGPYNIIINALWEGRIAVDITAGLQAPQNWSNRFRLSLFVHTAEALDVPSGLIATGAFGDIKNYNDRDFYLSWYPSGLVVDNSGIHPSPPPFLDKFGEQEICRSILDNLEEFMPATARIRKHMDRMSLRGGWVYATARGTLSDPQSSLHRRTDFGIFRTGSYISVDTGKYSTAPWLAHQIVQDIAPTALERFNLIHSQF